LHAKTYSNCFCTLSDALKTNNRISTS